jgi:hypothetical protein
MTTATTTPEMTAPARRGFAVACIRCGERDSVTLAVDDMSQFYCGSCDEGFTAADVRGLIDGWRPLLAWLETAPAYPG